MIFSCIESTYLELLQFVHFLTFEVYITKRGKNVSLWLSFPCLSPSYFTFSLTLVRSNLSPSSWHFSSRFNLLFFFPHAFFLAPQRNRHFWKIIALSALFPLNLRHQRDTNNPPCLSYMSHKCHLLYLTCVFKSFVCTYMCLVCVCVCVCPYPLFQCLCIFDD